MKQGKVRHWRFSEMGLQPRAPGHAALPVAAVQNEYSMLWRGPEKEVIPLCEQLGVGFVPWSPPGVQFLTSWIAIGETIGAGDGTRTARGLV